MKHVACSKKRLPTTCLLPDISTVLEAEHASYLLHVGFLLGLFFDPEDEGNLFLRNVG
jgi:hypothetical protein